MRKLLAIAVTALLPLTSTGAWAAVSGTAHAASGGTGAVSGDCSVCHIPHAAKGNRLWPAAPIAGANAGDRIGPFCAYCHLSTGGNYIVAARADLTVYAGGASPTGHGWGTVTNPDTNAANTGTLPYSSAGSGTIQCTTCHNVHDDTQRPFLRANQNALCSLCHPSRFNASGTWAGYGTGNTYGTHPVGTNVFGDTITAPHTAVDSPINATALGLRTYGTAADFRLGPKTTSGAAAFASGAGVACNSCHAVHGVETADGGGNATGTPGEDLLAIPQSAANGHANGAASARDALCEACHYGPTTTNRYDGVAYAGGFRPNPGATSYSHPVDNLEARMNWVTTFPTAWPEGTQVNATVGNAAICESCHMPHPAASATAQPSPAAPATVATGTPILRDSITAVCGRCHTSSPRGHHPANVAMGRFADANIVPSGTTLLCGHCHQSAHNWPAYQGGGGAALNPLWEPANNGRDTDGINNVNANNSKECVDCHLAGAAATTRSPTNYSTNGGAVVATMASGTTEYQDIGDGSHWIGTNGGAGYGVTYASGWLAAAFNPTSAAWPSTGWSRWGAASGAVVCESCHELEPDKNIASTSLLLHWYTEGGLSSLTGVNAVRSSGAAVTTAYTLGAANATSQFCTGCHGRAPGGGTPHPMTGSPITKVQDSGLGADGLARATTTLITAGGTLPGGGWTGVATSYMNQSNATILNGSFFTLPALNEMNCDSCHQVHDTPSNAGSWIIETPAANVTGGLAANFATSPGSANYQAFCIECHAY